MKQTIFAWLFLSSLLFMASCEEKGDALTTFILVRHAEKDDDGTDDPDLTPEGRARAKKLAYMLKDTPITAIYSTDFRRTRNTVQPISEIAGVDVKLYEPNNPDVISDILNENRGGMVLMAGHSNSIPQTANLLIGKKTYVDYAENQYGVILIVSVGETNRHSEATRLNY